MNPSEYDEEVAAEMAKAMAVIEDGVRGALRAMRDEEALRAAPATIVRWGAVALLVLASLLAQGGHAWMLALWLMLGALLVRP